MLLSLGRALESFMGLKRGSSIAAFIDMTALDHAARVAGRVDSDECFPLAAFRSATLQRERSRSSPRGAAIAFLGPRTTHNRAARAEEVREGRGSTGSLQRER